MITEDFVSFEVAKLLEEKGFNEVCFALYNPEGMLIQSGIRLNNIQVGRVKGSYSAPTLQMVMKWLREKGWFICIIPLAFYCGETASQFGYNIWAGDNLEIDEFNTPKFRTYEEACEDVIKYCLKNLN